MQFAYARGHHRLPRIAGQLRPSPGRLCVLRAGGQRPGAAGKRTGAVHRRCRSGDAWAQPGDPAAACCRWVGVAPAGMERGGGAAEAAAGAAQRPEGELSKGVLIGGADGLPDHGEPGTRTMNRWDRKDPLQAPRKGGLAQ